LEIFIILYYYFVFNEKGIVFKNKKLPYTCGWYIKKKLKPINLTIGSGWVIEQ
jgi:hypothetical protein